MTDTLDSFMVIQTEFYYMLTIALMFLIHVGFCMYEVGAARHKNHLHTLAKNTLLIPVITVTFYLFGWWLYFALPNGPGITGGLVDAPWAIGWSELMAPHMGGAPMSSDLTADDTMGWARINGVFFGAFLLFSWTVGSIISGGCIERIKTSAFLILAVAIGTVLWTIDAAWGWHPDGWMVQLWGYHDAYASGVVHAITGGFALGVLMVLGPRLGKFAADGTPRNINPHNPWLVTTGLFLIFTGFWGFYAACNTPMVDIQEGEGVFYSAVTIYGNPVTLSGITMNYLMSLSGGLLVGYTVSKGNIFWIYSGGLAGVITASAGNDLYHPIQAMLIGGAGTWMIYKLHFWVERKFKLDDPVGCIAVHGYAGVIGLIIAGFVLWGYPSSPNPDYAQINPLGQFGGAIVMFLVLGLIPGWILAKILQAVGILRVPWQVELAGLDIGEQEEARMDRESFEASEKAAATSKGSADGSWDLVAGILDHQGR